jgi:hypothetical protein
MYPYTNHGKCNFMGKPIGYRPFENLQEGSSLGGLLRNPPRPVQSTVQMIDLSEGLKKVGDVGPNPAGSTRLLRGKYPPENPGFIPPHFLWG